MKKIIIVFFAFFLLGCSNSLTLKETYFPNGKLETSFYEDSEGRIQGVFSTYFKNGNLSSTNNFIDGIANGVFKEYYENGEIKLISKIKNNKLNGKTITFYKSGKIESKLFFLNHKKTLCTFFYSNGKIERQASWRQNENVKDLPNCEVYFDKKGKILNDPYNFRKSKYAIVKYGKNEKSLRVKLFGFINDSVVINYKKSYKKDDKSYIRQIKVLSPKIEELVFDIRESDYYNGKINLLIESYYFAPVSEEFPDVKILPVLSEMCIQLDKREKPKKYNLDPIW